MQPIARAATILTGCSASRRRHHRHGECPGHDGQGQVGADATPLTQAGDTFTVQQDVVSNSSVRSFGYTTWLKAS
ncbi:MAG: hypothetical protein JWR55_1166 [Aeromicrobium sp.]|jgi:hypothetical protein|nr:hypothetical protein [Aeromicrobium sp.]